MKNVKIPEGYQQIMPYLIVKDATGFIKFTQNVFDAREKFKEMRDENTIRHAEVSIGDSVIMFADSTEQYKPSTASLFIYVDNTDEVYKKALKEGAVSLGEPANQSYGRSAGVRDPYGNTWWLTSELAG